ncbi:MAG: filamentous hemagglutinin N-terminal domain-containing protein, partial [Deltaproteobacteria bacterium]|nr:filamentous hemagglutinin N-terminal domain-containing protein [Deltaproteobacteria bacterium]
MKTINTFLISLLCFLLAFPAYLMAGPKDGQVVAGQAEIQQMDNLTTIDQSTNKAVLNWRSFDIEQNEAVRHNMPSSDSSALHRVIGGGGASKLAGELSSNGNIYLVNPAGVVIHQGARIDTGGFVASTNDISNENFMDNNLVFDKPGQAGAQILNQGHINVKESGLAALVAPSVRNEGVIAAKLGKVALASGDSAYKLDMYGDDLINFTVEEEKVDQLHAIDGTPLGVENTGKIKAEGGLVILSATQLDGVVSSVVNSGVVAADSAELKGGRVIFKGQGEKVGLVNIGEVTASSEVSDGGSITMVAEGEVKVSGQVKAEGQEKGGQIDISGQKNTEITEADLSAQGAQEGLIRLGGAFQGGKITDYSDRSGFVDRFGQLASLANSGGLYIDAASKISAGPDGTLILWSQGLTESQGFLSGRYLETSGKGLIIPTAPTVSPNGIWLIDPDNIT